MDEVKIEELEGYEELMGEMLTSLPPEPRLKGLAPEQRLAGLAPEQRLAGLAPEQLKSLLEAIRRKLDD